MSYFFLSCLSRATKAKPLPLHSHTALVMSLSDNMTYSHALDCLTLLMIRCSFCCCYALGIYYKLSFSECQEKYNLTPCFFFFTGPKLLILISPTYSLILNIATNNLSLTFNNDPVNYLPSCFIYILQNLDRIIT